MTLPLWILTVHWFGDFVLQNDWMATGKSKRLAPLGAHVGIYTVVLLVFFDWRWALVNGVLHLGTDFCTSRLNAYLWERKLIHWFFVSVGFDQLLHYTALLLTWKKV